VDVRGHRRSRYIGAGIEAPPEPRPHSKLGYLVVLLGALVFMVSCFLPYSAASFRSLAPVTPELSWFQLTVTNPPTALEHVGGFLHTFGGVAAIVWIAIAGLSGHRRWTRVALMAASGVWSLAWFSGLMGEYRLLRAPQGGVLDPCFERRVRCGRAVLVKVSTTATPSELDPPWQVPPRPEGSREETGSGRTRHIVWGRAVARPDEPDQDESGKRPNPNGARDSYDEDRGCDKRPRTT
jgi:hypothetical protein